MRAKEAIDLIDSHIAAANGSMHGPATYVRIGKALALDLCGASVSELGEAASRLFVEGLAAVHGMLWKGTGIRIHVEDSYGYGICVCRGEPMHLDNTPTTVADTVKESDSKVTVVLEKEWMTCTPLVEATVDLASPEETISKSLSESMCVGAPIHPLDEEVLPLAVSEQLLTEEPKKSGRRKAVYAVA